jgi:hypothetical protein
MLTASQTDILYMPNNVDQPISNYNNNISKEEVHIIIEEEWSNAGTFLARTGKSVTILERYSESGGEQETPHQRFLSKSRSTCNLSCGPGVRSQRSLGLTILANETDGYYVLKQGQKYPMPIDLSRLLTTRLLKGLRSKIEAIRFFATLNRIDPGKIQNISFQNWIDQKIHNSDVKDLVKMGARIATFANDAEIQSAGSTLSHLQIAYAGGAMSIDFLPLYRHSSGSGYYISYNLIQKLIVLGYYF